VVYPALIYLAFCHPIYAEEPLSGHLAQEDIYPGRDKDGIPDTEEITGDIFGKKSRWFHPELSLSEEYSNNILNTRSDKESDYITKISPTLWFCLPGRDEKISPAVISTSIPGGEELSSLGSEFTGRMLTYVLYNFESEIYAENSGENVDSHNLDARFQLNLKSGHSLGVSNTFMRSYDTPGTGVSTELDRYRDNLAKVFLNLMISERLRITGDYSHFYLKYDADRNAGRNRYDDTFSSYIFFHLFPKTAALIGCELTNINYEEETRIDSPISDGREQRYYAGLDWQITAKSRGRLKSGTSIKTFDDSSMDKDREYLFELQLSHQFTPRTSLVLNAYRRPSESTINQAAYSLKYQAGSVLTHRITHKISGSLECGYTNEKFKGDLIYGPGKKERKDDYFSAAPSLNYQIKRWLSTGLYYVYEERESNFSDFSYSTNTISLMMKATL
jgi:hypothetical protein